MIMVGCSGSGLCRPGGRLAPAVSKGDLVSRLARGDTPPAERRPHWDRVEEHEPRILVDPEDAVDLRLPWHEQGGEGRAESLGARREAHAPAGLHDGDSAHTLRSIAEDQQRDLLEVVFQVL